LRLLELAIFVPILMVSKGSVRVLACQNHSRSPRYRAARCATAGTGAQLLELGKQCLQKGSVAVALEGLTVTLGCRAPLPADQREVGTASGHDGAGHDGQTTRAVYCPAVAAWMSSRLGPVDDPIRLMAQQAINGSPPQQRSAPLATPLAALLARISPDASIPAGR